jgi:DNA-binding transcriptional LysR family regulator
MNIFPMPMLASDHLKDIAYFVQAADAGSFTGAAERLMLSSSAISKSLARLEARLGARLFDRSTRSLTLTDAGRRYYETCQRVLMELAETEAALAQASEPAGRLLLGLPASFGRLRVMPVLLRFCEQYPNLRPHVTFTDRFVDLQEEGLDLAVRIGGPAHWPASLGHLHLGDERLIFCATPAYLARRGTPRTIADLGRHDCIVYGRPDGSPSPWLFASPGGQTERRTMAHRMLAGDGEAQMAAVLADMGVAQLATWLVRDHLASGRVVEVMADMAIDGLPLHVVWPRGRPLTPKVAALLGQFQEQLTIR